MNRHLSPEEIFGPLIDHQQDFRPANDLPPTQRHRFKILLPADYAAAQAPRYLIKGLLGAGDLGVLFGPPGAGKSVVAPYLAHAVATGRDAFGRRVNRGRVVYCAAEDETGLMQRIRALSVRYGEADGLGLITATPNFTSSDDPVALRYAARAFGATLVVIDTLAAAFPGIDENDARGMGLVVHTLRQLGKPAEPEGDLPAWSGAAVLVVHHGAKAGGTTPRGHGILDGAADVTLRVSLPEDRSAARSVTLGKNRNGPCGDGFAFSIIAERLGTDADGDTITAPVCAEDTIQKAPKNRPKLSDRQQLLLQTITDLGAAGAGISEPACPNMAPVLLINRSLLVEQLLQDEWFEHGHLLPENSPKRGRLADPGHKAIHQVLNSLKSKKLIGFTRDAVWLV